MEWLKYFSVIAASMLKFLGGPLAGLAMGLPWQETAICSIVGMMLTVCIVLFLNNAIGYIRQRYFPPKNPVKRFGKTKRWAVKIKQRFGLWGLAGLTPIIFSPPIGTALAVAFRYKPSKIILKMFLSACFWAVVQCLVFYGLRGRF